jgi:IS30 family transposase
MSHSHLSHRERVFITYLNMEGVSQAKIARRLGRHRGTVGRELKRNVSVFGHYDYHCAHEKAKRRRADGATRPVTGDAELMAHVEAKLTARWSAEQIAGRLAVQPPKHLAGKTIDHATIYRWIWADRERAARLKPYLRVACKPRRKPYGKPSKRGQIRNRTPIADRPDVVEQRDRLGDWEGDTVVGKGRSGHVLTNVDRASRYLVTRKLERATAMAVETALVGAMRRMTTGKRRTQTFDNGREFSAHESIAKRLRLDVYFADPYSSWQRGTNENTNGLLRQYLPKSRLFNTLTAGELARYTWQLNNRPRKCLDYRTPAEMFHQRDVAFQM